MQPYRKKIKSSKDKDDIQKYDVFSDQGQKEVVKQSKIEVQAQDDLKGEQANRDDKLVNYIREGDTYLFDITSKKRVCVNQFNKQTYVSIREYFSKDGELLPTKKGISLNIEQWNRLKQYIDEIDLCVQKVQKN